MASGILAVQKERQRMSCEKQYHERQLQLGDAGLSEIIERAGLLTTQAIERNHSCQIPLSRYPHS